MSPVRHIYRVLRSFFVALILATVGLYIALYVALAIPGVQNLIRQKAQTELSSFLKGNVKIGKLDIVPFSELRLYDVIISDSTTLAPCLQVARLGAAIDLADLIFNRRISISYAELSGVRADIVQERKDGPLNIDFIIKAFEPKDKNKPPAHFDLTLRKIAIRNTSVSFIRNWAPALPDGKFDANRMKLTSLNMDVQLPRLSDNEIKGHISRLSFKIEPGLSLSNLTASICYTSTSLDIDGLKIKLTDSDINIPSFSLRYPDPSEIGRIIKNGDVNLKIAQSRLNLNDLSPLVPALRSFDFPILFSLIADGGLQNIDNLEFKANLEGYRTELDLQGEFRNLDSIKFLSGDITKLKLKTSPAIVNVIRRCIPSLSDKQAEIIRNLGDISLDLKGNGEVEREKFNISGKFVSNCGSFDFDAIKENDWKASIITSGLEMDRIFPDSGVGMVSFSADVELGKGKYWPSGEINLLADLIEFKGNRLHGLNISGRSDGSEAVLSIISEERVAALALDARISESINGIIADANININNLEPAAFGLMKKKYPGYDLKGFINASLSGPTLSESNIDLHLDNFTFDNNNGEGIRLDYLDAHLIHSILTSDKSSEANKDRNISKKGYHRTLNLESPWISVDAEIADYDADAGKSIFDFSGIKNGMMKLLSETFPVLNLPEVKKESAENVKINIDLKADPEIYRFWNLPLYPLGRGHLEANLDGSKGCADFQVDIPYIQQGRNLIEKTKISGSLDRRERGLSIAGFTHYPTKKGTLDLDIDLQAENDDIMSNLHFYPGEGNLMSGNLTINTLLGRSPLTNKLQVNSTIIPSQLRIGDSDWKLDSGNLIWKDGKGYVNNLNIESAYQYVNINGVASEDKEESLLVKLGGIDLDYVFSILNINYVTFGGLATGEIIGSGVLSGNPDLHTKFLNVKNFSYNSSILGDAGIQSNFDVKEKKVVITADIRENEKRVAKVNGGIWVTRDSLSFELDADKVNAGFMNPFVQAFAGEVTGRASGILKLYGTFSDIDLIGRAKADSLSLRLISTNVVYTGSDSIILHPGNIEIPGFRIYDKNGNSALLTGTLKHHYFHDPEFDFRLVDAKGLLCYDTNPTLNPDWYGTIFGNGSGHLMGRPGYVGVEVDMTSDRNSTFTFVLSDKEQAADYNFLTFTDKKKEALIAQKPDTIPYYLKQFLKNENNKESGEESAVELDFRATITPDVLVTLVMDPEAGDKITTRGNGSLQMNYNSKSEDLRMYGKYILDEGEYNFSLQDIILKQFIIQPGSNISFNGDPLNANLDIAATYRVNANLTDLDQSFANDHDLNRTNVPVDAVMIVRGNLNEPSINFDIALPTLTADVERKIKSLMSTDDLLSRQIIYLLALNRFYTPENANMGTTGGSGGTELTSVASSTISSHLSNILSNMTDHLVVSPSFRSDKGDFSDVELDLGLSSRLLDNRLLINGNLGYRDRNTAGQSTQFIGDFDIEYLLNKSGNLRLKAYNRFNDQNYYLRQALTTQGVGIVVRRDFDNIFSFLRPIRRKLEEIEKKSESDKSKDSTVNRIKGERDSVVSEMKSY